MNEIKNKLIEEFKNNETIVVATSGGPDSMALLNILVQIKEKKHLNIICAHVNHNLRAESKAEEKMVQEFCLKNGLSCEIMTIDDYDTSNIENQARTKRYEFFEKIVKKCQAKYLLTAHHGDDLVETILMRLTKGSSLKGYQGFGEKTVKKNYIIYRPLITVTKNDILKYCEKEKINYAMDKTNTEDTYTRNRYRKYILPKLKEENKNVHHKFYKFSKTLSLYDQYINKEVDKYYKKVYQDKLLIDKFIKLDNLIQIKIIEKILFETYQNNISLIHDKHTDQILKVIHSNKPNQIVNLPNKKVGIKEYNYFYLKNTENTKNYKIKLDSEVKINNKIIKIIKEPTDHSNYTIYLDSKEIKLPLYIRNKQDGDKIEIKGLNGSKKIKDIFIDEKINKTQRDTWPLLVDSNDIVLWIPGLKKSKFDKQKNENYDIIIKCM